MKKCAIKLDDWHLLRDVYAVLGDVEDLEALADNFEAFGVNPLWMVVLDKKQFVIIGREELGIMFIRIPKWRRKEAEAAFDNYYKRMCWKHPDFESYAEQLAEIISF